MAVTYENLLIAGGRFENDGGDIETVTVPATSTIARGTVLGRVATTGKYVTSKGVTYTTTGASQVVTTAVDEIVDIKVALGGTGTGTTGNFYRAKTIQATIDLENEDFSSTTNWEDLGAIAGSEVAVAVLEEDAANATGGAIDVKAVVLKKGTFNSLGVTFGINQTLANTQNDLHNVSIEITQGVA